MYDDDYALAVAGAFLCLKSEVIANMGLERLNKLPVWAVWVICVTACVAFWVIAGTVVYGIFK